MANAACALVARTLPAGTFDTEEPSIHAYSHPGSWKKSDVGHWGLGH